MPPKEHDCIQEDRISEMEKESRRVVTWEQGIAVVGGAFGICCLGFLLLHGLVVSDRAEASTNLSQAVATQNARVNRLEDHFDTLMTENEKQHREMMTLLLRMQK